MMKKFEFADALIAAAFVLMLLAASVAAQATSVSITPASIDTAVKAGASYTQKFTFTNG